MRFWTHKNSFVYFDLKLNKTRWCGLILNIDIYVVKIIISHEDVLWDVLFWENRHNILDINGLAPLQEVSHPDLSYLSKIKTLLILWFSVFCIFRHIVWVHLKPYKRCRVRWMNGMKIREGSMVWPSGVVCRTYYILGLLLMI